MCRHNDVCQLFTSSFPRCRWQFLRHATSMVVHAGRPRWCELPSSPARFLAGVVEGDRWGKARSSNTLLLSEGAQVFGRSRRSQMTNQCRGVDIAFK